MLQLNQIVMHVPDKDHTSSIVDVGLCYYKVRSFGLKNVKATNQRLVNKMFETHIGRMVEVYVDDMLVMALIKEYISKETLPKEKR